MTEKNMNGDLALQKTLDGLVEKYGVVGATAGVFRNGETQLAASGLLNASTGVEVTPDSVFQIGSIGKMFTSTLMMQLVDEGKLDLDEPVRRYFPEFAIADESAAARITSRMLLSHLSGMEGDFFPSDDPEGPSTLSYVRKMRLLPQLTEPGEQPMAYCNSGFVVAGRIIEILTGLTWERAVMERICQPLQMNHAFTNLQHCLKYRCAIGHVNSPEDPHQLIVAPQPYLPLSAAAAGTVLSMSAESLLRFAEMHLNNGVSGSGTRVLSEQSVQKMQEAQTVLPEFSLPEFNHWGLGWMLGHFDSYESYGHDGGTFGQFCYLRVFPEQNVAIALLTNSRSPEMALDFLDWASDAAAGCKRPVESAAEPQEFDVARYVGDYGNISARQSVRTDGNKLSMRFIDTFMGSPDVLVSLLPYQKDVFIVETDNPLYTGIKIRFMGNDDKGRAKYSRITVRTLRRLKD